MVCKGRQGGSKKSSNRLNHSNFRGSLDMHGNDGLQHEEVEAKEGFDAEQGRLDEMEVEGHANNSEQVPKEKRGGTFKTDIYGRPSHKPPPKVCFSSCGVPTGANRKDFVEFLGTLARNGMHAPLHIEDWQTMPSDNLEGILETVKKKENGHSPSHAELFEKCYTDAKGNPSSGKVAEAIHEMDVRTSQLPLGSIDSSSQNDVFSQVMGKDKKGRVRMRGLGATLSIEWG